jgi:hypothetical protein
MFFLDIRQAGKKIHPAFRSYKCGQGRLVLSACKYKEKSRIICKFVDDI